MSAGVKSLSPTLDVIGGFGRSVPDAALLGAVLTGDTRLMDATAQDIDNPPRIGLFATPNWGDVDADIQTAWMYAEQTLSKAGASCTIVPSPTGFESLVQLQKEICSYEMAHSLSHERLRHRAQISAALNGLFDEGMKVDGISHAQNLMLTQEWRQKIQQMFVDHDVILTPSTLGEAPFRARRYRRPPVLQKLDAAGLALCAHPVCQRTSRLARRLTVGGCSWRRPPPAGCCTLGAPTVNAIRKKTMKIRRVVTGHDSKGKAVVVHDEMCSNIISRRPQHHSCVVWSTGQFPVDNQDPANGNTRDVSVLQKQDTVFRIVQYDPGVAPRNHRTETIDYAIVMSGSIDMDLDGTTVHLNQGDVIVQRGTIHNWINHGNVPCVIAFILIAANPIDLDHQTLQAHG
ncbi:MAG: cupin domain-containing protein [Betaproteobacteria bacterium]|nr:cupin domain-containing protein [Betaproteobacteria bacterium]